MFSLDRGNGDFLTCMCGCDMMQTGMDEDGDDESNGNLCVVPEMRISGQASILDGEKGRMSVVEV